MRTYWAILRPDGTSHGEGKGVIMTKDGSSKIATGTGRGVGKRIDSSCKIRYANALFLGQIIPLEEKNWLFLIILLQ